MNIDIVWNILGPVRVGLTPGLKQSVASGVGAEADQDACKVSDPVLNLCRRARPPGPSKAILESSQVMTPLTLPCDRATQQRQQTTRRVA
jgi:hypothetical protein